MNQAMQYRICSKIQIVQHCEAIVMTMSVSATGSWWWLGRHWSFDQNLYIGLPAWSQIIITGTDSLVVVGALCRSKSTIARLAVTYGPGIGGTCCIHHGYAADDGNTILPLGVTLVQSAS